MSRSLKAYRMITLQTLFLIGLCFLCYLLFKSSSIPSVAPELRLFACFAGPIP